MEITTYRNFSFQAVKDRSVPQRVYIVATGPTGIVICGDWRLSEAEAIDSVKASIDNFGRGSDVLQAVK